MVVLLQKWLRRGYDIVGGLLFAIVFWGVMSRHLRRYPLIWLIMLAVSGLLVMANRLISKWNPSPKVYWLVVSVLYVVMVALHILAVWAMEVELLVGDAYCVVSSALGLVGENYRYRWEYFAQYQNQCGMLVVLQVFASVIKGLFGTVNSTHLSYANMFMVDLSVLITVGLAEAVGRKAGHTKTGLRALILCLFTPFLYLLVPYIYTDALCLPFLMGALAASVWAIDKLLQDNSKRTLTLFHQEISLSDILRFMLVGVLIGLGYAVKGNLIILLAALIILLFTLVPFRKWAQMSAVLLIGFLLAHFAFQGYLYGSGLLTKESSDRYKFPVTHWIMMGMDHLGVSSEDVSYTRSFESYEQKKEAIAKRMRDKYRKMGVGGVIHQMFYKAYEYAWDDGTFASMLSGLPGKIEPVRPGWIHEYIFRSDSSKFKTYFNTCTAIWTVLELLMLSSYFSFTRSKQWGLCLCRLFMTGTLVFFMFWETRPRYIVSSLEVVFIICAVQLEDFCQLRLRDAGKRIARHSVNKHLLHAAQRSMDAAITDCLDNKDIPFAKHFLSAGRWLQSVEKNYEILPDPSAPDLFEKYTAIIQTTEQEERLLKDTEFFLHVGNRRPQTEESLAGLVQMGQKLKIKLKEALASYPSERLSQALDQVEAHIQELAQRPIKS